MRSIGGSELYERPEFFAFVEIAAAGLLVLGLLAFAIGNCGRQHRWVDIGTTQLTPVGGKVVLDLGSPPEEAARLKAGSARKIAQARDACDVAKVRGK